MAAPRQTIYLTENDLILRKKKDKRYITGFKKTSAKMLEIDDGGHNVLVFPDFSGPVVIGQGKPLTNIPADDITSLKFGANCVEIAENAFSLFTYLEDLTFGPDLAHIGANNFLGSPDLVFYTKPLTLNDKMPTPGPGLNATFLTTNNPGSLGLYYVIHQAKLYQMDVYGDGYVSAYTPEKVDVKFSKRDLSQSLENEHLALITADSFVDKVPLPLLNTCLRPKMQGQRLDILHKLYHDTFFNWRHQLNYRYCGKLSEVLDENYFADLPRDGKLKIQLAKKKSRSEFELIKRLIKLVLTGKKYDYSDTFEQANDNSLGFSFTAPSLICRHITKVFNAACVYAGFVVREIVAQTSDEADKSSGYRRELTGHCFSEIYSPALDRGLPIDITALMDYKFSLGFSAAAFKILYDNLLLFYDAFNVENIQFPVDDYDDNFAGNTLIPYANLASDLYNAPMQTFDETHFNRVCQLLNTPTAPKTSFTLYKINDEPDHFHRLDWLNSVNTFGNSRAKYKELKRKAS